MIGKRFGNWIVVDGPSKSYSKQIIYLCECKCGRFFTVLKTNLVHGLSKGCRQCSNDHKMIKFKVGDVIGSWTIIGLIKRKHDGKLYHKCKCICGNESYILSTILKNGLSTRCKNCPKYKIIKESK